MKSKKQSPIWPYLGILACLFVLSVTAPRAWERMARQETLSQLLASRTTRAGATAEPQPATTYERIDADELKPREPLNEPPAVQHEASVPAPRVPITLVNPPPPVPPVPEYAAEVKPEEKPPVTAIEPVPEPTAEPEAVAESAPDDPDDADALADGAWPLPHVLLEQLSGVAEQDAEARWAVEAQTLIRELCQPPTARARSADDILADLERVSNEGKLARSPRPKVESSMVRANYALTRWLGIWRQAIDLDTTTTLTAEVESSGERIVQCLADVESQMSLGPSGTAWRKYLKLDALARLARADAGASENERRAVARTVLDRLASTNLTRAQRKFIADGPIAGLQGELRVWAAEPVASVQLLADVDKYEQSGLPSDALAVANDCRGLRWTKSAQSEAVSEHLETHYRNANVRLALSRELLNLLIPQPMGVEESFHDTVLNVPVYGRNTTFTDLSVRLVPDPKRIRLGLEASGLVASNSVSASGPARFYSAGQSTFLVRKLFVLGPDGLSVWPAVAEAENYNYLKEVETDYDGLPIVGSLVRNYARSQHDEKRMQARMEVEQKVAIRARDQLDSEVRPRLEQTAERLEKHQMATLRRLGLELVPVGLSTTEERAVARALLASPEQLGAHTPRPRAPSDSWVSLQIHQSALNNGLERMDLAGRAFTLDELFAFLAAKLARPELAKQADLPEDVWMKFADKDAVRVRCENDRVELLISFAELKQGSRRWRDFTVRTYYKPEALGLAPMFVRDSAVFVDGDRVKSRPHLYAIFSKVLSRDRDLRLLEESLTGDRRFSSLAITQFVVDHGWVGLAYSPRRGSNNVVRRPE